MSMLRNAIRRRVPLSLRQTLADYRRRWRDLRNGIRFSDRRSEVGLSGYTLQVEITQQVMPGVLFDNKLANLAHGASRVNLSMLAPGQTWSFWRCIGKPDEHNGFAIGRNIVNGDLTRQVGGGLCQLSSLMYHLGLCAGLGIVERHAHSIDIYCEHERFTPLGADATVVWGFKDLRLSNPHDVEVLFECFVEAHSLTGRVYARSPLPRYQVAFLREPENAGAVSVHTMINDRPHTRTDYLRKQGLALPAAG